MRRCLAQRTAVFLVLQAALARTPPPQASVGQPVVSASATGAATAARATSSGGEQGVPLEAFLFQSPLTCLIAAIDWAQSSEASSSWSQGIALISEEARVGMIGGVPRGCVIAICAFMTVILIMTLCSLSAEAKDTSNEDEFPFAHGADLKSAVRSGRPGTAPKAVPPICPKLMLPHGAAQFRIPMDYIRKLRSGIFPVEVYGTSKDPLLHAWLPRFATSVEEPADDCVADVGCGGVPTPRSGLRGQGLWLQLTTTSTSRHPHACIGPLFLRGMSASKPSETIQILGPGGKRYGSFEQTEDSWKVVCDGRTVLTVTTSLPFPLLNALDSQGYPVASAGQQRWSLLGTDALIVTVNQGADALLALLCMLAVVLVSVDLAVPPMKLATFGGGDF
mmetsp:Transcript_91996/g.269114  ORF Transcript_91996/g.269114 Transcript_91996/m.269114 type:complete len:392 (+) Transcript_91996:81-1256(+)